MRAAETLLGQNLPGKKIKGNWHVFDKIERRSTDTGGRFSVGYKVRHDDGREAFMKASDCSLLGEEGDDMFGKFAAGILSYKSEIEILDYCRGNNMDRVVVSIDYGQTLIIYDGIQQPLVWIIFELASSDARRQLTVSSAFDFTWALHAMHNLSVGVKQLHTASVAHNDIKPSNVLIFDPKLQKLGDLGSATSTHFATTNDHKSCAGDPIYAAPENLYSHLDNAPAMSFERRRASELYLLGSMACFLVSQPMVTPYLLSKLDPIHRPICNGSGWQGDFEGVLPYWNEAFSEMLIEIEASLPKKDGQLTDAAKEYLTAISQLCNPNPAKRGHPTNLIGQRDRYSVERYISIFDRLRKRAMVKSIAA